MEKTVCQTCGDPGWSVALIYCEECQEFAVHRYCLKVLPKTFDEYVIWHCDDCKFELPIFNGVAETISHSTKKTDLDLRLVDFLRTTNKRLRKTQINKEDENEKNQQVVKDEDGDTQEQEGPLAASEAKSLEGEIVNGHSEDSCGTKSSEQVKDEYILTLENEKNSVADSDMKMMLSPLPELDSSRQAFDNYVPAQPIIDPIWRGCLSVTGSKEDYSCQILAHVSRLACFRVSQEAQLFPEVLSSVLHPRLTVWPKGFEEHGPNDDSIALYLFPESESDEKVFKSLVTEMIRSDQALRAVVTHAELLVFPSTKLPLRLWSESFDLFLTSKKISMVRLEEVNLDRTGFCRVPREAVLVGGIQGKASFIRRMQSQFRQNTCQTR